jgi:hypothetical protein
MTEFLAAAGPAIPTLAGLKFSSAEFGELAGVLALRTRWIHSYTHTLIHSYTHTLIHS